jgi:hypothetical protein
MKRLTEFIEKQIQDKKTQRWVIESEVLFTLFKNMGIMEDQDMLMDIIDYLEENKIDVYFNNTDSNLFFGKFTSIEKSCKIRKKIGINSEKIKQHINMVNSLKIEIDDDYFKTFMTDDNEEIKEIVENLPKFDKHLENLQSKIDKEKFERHLENNPINQDVFDLIRNNQ